ncbi:DUF3015 family protein [Bermanella marisrubri]|nr:DUF3015 family protein [Bermanella marisrubri]QIZ83293.1 DUF3015 family protein [Bermanella marisrubri]
MKKLIAGAAFAVAASSSFASPAGCGLGTAVVFPEANEWYEHVMAATTNGTSGNQTFGMTSGTLGCEEANGPLKLARVFMDQNMEQLAVDSARGQGESLEALTTLIGVEQADKVEFSKTLQSNFDSIFVSTDASSEQAYSAMVEAMAANEKLAKYLG